MMGIPPKRYIRNLKTISGRLHDEMVMMDIEQGKYFSLNPVATRIWELLEEHADSDTICNKLLDEYDVNPDQCRAEVSQVLEELLGMGLIFILP